MFRKLAGLLKGQTFLTEADAVFTFHPEQLSRWLEEVWANGGIAIGVPVIDTVSPAAPHHLW